MPAIDLSRFDNSHYKPGRSVLVQAAWFFLGSPILRCQLLPSSAIRRTLLRMFGARIAAGVVIKPGVRVKYPWLLEVGENSWIGEDAWIDNLALVSVGSNACISQGAYLCTGNHDWTDPAFGLIVRTIRIGDGAWVGARAVICPGAELGDGAIASAGAVVAGSLKPFMIYSGNPAAPVKQRILTESPSFAADHRLIGDSAATKLPAKS